MEKSTMEVIGPGTYSSFTSDMTGTPLAVKLQHCTLNSSPTSKFVLSLAWETKKKGHIGKKVNEGKDDDLKKKNTYLKPVHSFKSTTNIKD